ncbi:MAG: FAD-dependent thymidylate synthase [Deltaproteobacteria bacterium]|nr:FAD-dependent thymidylate synthase [Deltaproteobacteria bacterium]MBI3296012.1 FAD-dependent thymidylate synthase [Deltaproteobacteria bacterium]
MTELRSLDQIEVKLAGAIQTPYELAVATARTCYSGKGIIWPDDVSANEKSIALRDRIASSTLEAGHLTTRQHASFVFAISGVSRQFIWNFLHSHPYYNSEQVSQRYVRVKPDNFLLPPLPESCARIYKECVFRQIATYERLIDLLREPISADYYTRFPARKKDPNRWGGNVDKRAFEVSRYVLGIGTTAYLYHTVSALTLLRYNRLIQLFDTPMEQKIVVEKMLDAVRALDPLFEKDIVDPVPLEQTLEAQHFHSIRGPEASQRFIEEFDRSLEGHTSKLIHATENAEGVLAHSVRVMLGLATSELSNEAAVDLVLNPKTNPVLADTLNPSVLDRASQCLHHVSFTFHKKISHTADSQDQRHRTVLSSRPGLSLHYTGRPDFITPFGITQSPEAQELYEKTIRNSFETINQVLDAGVSREFALYLLPNAFPIRMISSGALHGWHHKWKMRSCYNAQEEIFRATIEEVRQVATRFPVIGRHLKAPCYLRLQAGTKPFCPEGDKFCGLPVWKYTIDQYQRKSL